MRKALVVAALLALVAAAPAAAGVRIGGVDTSGFPAIRVSVVAPAGGAAPVIREDGRPVVGMTATNLGRGKSVVLAVDRSQSMAGQSLRDAKAAARAFVDARQPGDQLSVVAFGRDAVALSHFSAAGADADAALQGLATDSKSGTALWDAIVLAAKQLKGQTGPGHVILVLTDGQDVSSLASLDDAIRAANQARASVYAIGIAGHGFSPDPLRELAARTGGEYREASSTAQLSALYASISQTLDRTWEVGYDTAARPGDSIDIAAAVAGQGAASRTVRVVAAGSGALASQHPTMLKAAVWRASYTPLILAAAVGLLLLLAAGFVAASRSGLWLSTRLAPHLGPSEQRGRRARRRHGGFRQIFHSTEQVFSGVRQFRALQRLLTRADLPLLAAEMLYICLGTGVVVGLVFAVAGTSPLLVLLLMAAGAGLPVLYVLVRANDRVKAFDNQLPDLLITIAASLKAGHSFRHAVQSVVDEGVDPAAKEFKRVLTETQLGRSMDVALADMGERLGSKNLAFVLTAVTIQRQIGGSLAGLFDMVSETVRQRQQFGRKIKGLTAMGRMSAYVLAGLPFFLAAVISLMNPSYMAPLWSTSAGHMLVALSLSMMVVGALILKKMVSFKG